MLGAFVLVALMLLISTRVVGRLLDLVRQREAALVAANQRLQESSRLDPLTGLFNRRELVRRIELELARVRRGRCAAIAMIDLDGFKRVNDERGHVAGDELLRQIATALAASTRETDSAGRYGGDEFVVVLPDADAEQARLAAERLIAAVREAARAYDAERPVTASAGVALARESDGVFDLVRRADERAYRAKQAGGDRVEAEQAASEVRRAARA
jgi:diguanylate cyclase (GGDEF)-like protein